MRTRQSGNYLLGIGFRFASALSDLALAFVPARRRGLGRNAGGLLGWGLRTEKSATQKTETKTLTAHMRAIKIVV